MTSCNDFPDEEWVEDEGDSEDDLLSCPSCRQAVHEDTQQCPHCGDWITPIATEPLSKRLIWVAAALLVIVSLILYTVL